MTTRFLGIAPGVTLIVSFAIVFGLGLLIGPAPETHKLGPTVATTAPVDPTEPPLDDRAKQRHRSTPTGSVQATTEEVP